MLANVFSPGEEGGKNSAAPACGWKFCEAVAKTLRLERRSGEIGGRGLQGLGRPLECASSLFGGIAQLGERLHGMQEVSGSIPLTSTTTGCSARSVPIV